MRDTSGLRIVRQKHGYRLETNAEPPIIIGLLVRVDNSMGHGWRYWPSTIGSSMSRKVWPTPAAAIEARRMVPADWVRAAIAAADAGE